MKLHQNEDINEIKELFTILQEGYHDRDCKKVDDMLDEIFTLKQIPMIIGTNIDELCIGREEVKDLFEMDWKYWGDVTFDVSQLHVSIHDSVAYFVVPGNVHYRFVVNDEVYQIYVKLMLERLNKCDVNSLKNDLLQLQGTLNSASFLKKEGIKEYDWPLLVTGMVMKEENSWKIVFMKYSLKSIKSPDHRLEQSLEFQQQLQNFLNKLANSAKVNNNQDNSIKKLLQLYFKNPALITNSKMIFVDLKQQIHFDTQMFINYIKEYDNQLQYYFEHSFIYQSNNQYFIVIPSLFSYKKSLKESFNLLLEEVSQYDSSIPAKEQLYFMQSKFNKTLQEIEYGDQYSYAFRTTVGFSFQENKLIIHMICFSYPIKDART